MSLIVTATRKLLVFAILDEDMNTSVKCAQCGSMFRLRCHRNQLLRGSQHHCRENLVQHGSKAGKRDPAHNVLAMVIIYSMWCGWLSQAKANRGGYPREWVDSFKKLIVDAFEIGQKYSISD